MQLVRGIKARAVLFFVLFPLRSPLSHHRPTRFSLPSLLLFHKNGTGFRLKLKCRRERALMAASSEPTSKDGNVRICAACGRISLGLSDESRSRKKNVRKPLIKRKKNAISSMRFFFWMYKNPFGDFIKSIR